MISFYFLNNVKNPSPKLRTYLHVLVLDKFTYFFIGEHGLKTD